MIWFPLIEETSATKNIIEEVWGGIKKSIMSDIEHLIVVVIIILISGVLGGTVNYFRESTPLSENHSYLKKLFPGIAASFVVPLFLNMI